jgi:hypothetical protein
MMNGSSETKINGPRRDNGGKREGKGNRTVEGQVHDLIHERTYAVRGAPRFGQLRRGKVSAIEIIGQPDEFAQRLFAAQGFGGGLIDRCGLGAAKGAAVLDFDDHLFVLGMDRLQDYRSDGQGDEQQHRKDRRQYEGEESPVFQGSVLSSAARGWCATWASRSALSRIGHGARCRCSSDERTYDARCGKRGRGAHMAPHGGICHSDRKPFSMAAAV